MPLGREVDLGPGDIVLDCDPGPPQKGHSPQFLAHICCGEMAGWIKMPLGTEVGHCVRWGSSYPYKGAQHLTLFGPCLLWPNG